MIDFKAQLTYRKAEIKNKLFLDKKNPYLKLFRAKLKILPDHYFEVNYIRLRKPEHIPTQFWWWDVLDTIDRGGDDQEQMISWHSWASASIAEVMEHGVLFFF